VSSPHGVAAPTPASAGVGAFFISISPIARYRRGASLPRLRLYYSSSLARIATHPYGLDSSRLVMRPAQRHSFHRLNNLRDASDALAQVFRLSPFSSHPYRRSMMIEHGVNSAFSNDIIVQQYIE